MLPLRRAINVWTILSRWILGHRRGRQRVENGGGYVSGLLHKVCPYLSNTEIQACRKVLFGTEGIDQNKCVPDLWMGLAEKEVALICQWPQFNQVVVNHDEPSPSRTHNHVCMWNSLSSRSKFDLRWGYANGGKTSSRLWCEGLKKGHHPLGHRLISPSIYMRISQYLCINHMNRIPKKVLIQKSRIE